eukprot:TRINITY_DN5753_c0_g2_i1.p1 TRINITY_DN5753_c0_g2~~TRINITY_DN5753_c0_g2_i1.p1  ORF type:complete len:500 (-),score=104.60 TRINITY_DN5753_c0_g2_i1:294-1793(-)
MMDLYGRGATMSLGLNTENSSVPCFLERFLDLGSPESLTEESNDSKASLKICSVKAGGMMSLAIDSLGALWMWGNCPQKSSNNDVEFSLVSSATPLPIWDLHGHTVVKVACGNEHIVALVSAGETFTGGELILYSWGNNNHGQLGLGDKESRPRPEIVETFNQNCPWAVYEIACGAFHTAILTKKKACDDMADSLRLEERESMCWTFGLGENGQLGHGSTNSTSLPEPVEGFPQDAFLISLDCGLFHTSVVSAAGTVWSWGMEKGLGLCPDANLTGTDAGDALSPLRIVCDELHGAKFADPMQVACGAAHTVLVTHDGYKLWAWGRGRSGVLGRGNMVDSFVPCIVMWPPLDEDFEEEGLDMVGSGAMEENKDVRGVDEIEKRLSLAMEEVQVLQSKLTVMERYARILHVSIYRKAFEERDLPSSLCNSDVFDIEKDWENMIESKDDGQLARMEAFYRNMLGRVKDKLMKRKIQEMINECLHSLSTGSRVSMENASPSQ